MAKTFPTICPNCNQTIHVPYAEAMRDMGRRSLSKRNTDSEHMRAVRMKRYSEGYIHPKQQAILDLSKTEDLNKLTYKQIAEKIGIVSRWPGNAVWRHKKVLEEKGLLTLPRRIIINTTESIHPKQQAILALSRTKNFDKLTHEEVADKIGLVGKYRRHYVGYHIKKLQKMGLLPARE